MHWHFNYRGEKNHKYELQNFHSSSDSGENQIKDDEGGEIWQSWERENIQGGAKRTHVFESACDFFLWSYLKSKVYVRKPRTVDDLNVSIREDIAIVPQEILVNVMQNFEGRLRKCVRQEGRHLSDIIFRN